MKKLVFVLLAVILYVVLPTGTNGTEQKTDSGQLLSLGDVVTRSGKIPRPRKPGQDCKIRKQPKNQCLNIQPLEPPICIADECKFTPKYGEEVTQLWQLLDISYNNGQEKKYRKILDLGEDLTKSFDAEVCQAEHRICHCEDSCNCKRERVVRVCKQKYKYKYGRYYVYNTYFCRPKPFNPMQFFYKHLGQGQGYNPMLSMLMSQYKMTENTDDRRDNSRERTRRDPRRSFGGYPSPDTIPPILTYNNPPVMPNYYTVPPSHNYGMGSMPHMPNNYGQFQQSPSSMAYMYYIMSMANQQQMNQDLDSYVQCPKEKKMQSTPGYFDHNYQNLDMNTMLRTAWLKIKVPDGCECEELKNYDKHADS